MIEILTAILVVVTAFYAWFTRKILKANEVTVQQMRLQQESLLRPYIVISPLFYPGDIVFHLKIENTGMTLARNLRLSIDKRFYQFADTSNGTNNLQSFSAFNVPIESFAPGAQMVFDLAQGYKILGSQADQNVTPPVFEISASYEYFDKKVSERTQIDLRPYRDALLPHDAVASEVKGLRHVLDRKRPSF